ncbi:hypothetical protein SDC9_54982 [bioreactor metagenome]|uniref:Uncharacterized protein n=1 Tax=bioreactor metagenome TaxID=1076179 RepID=A0A644WYX2_9ZZZZ
MGSRENNSVNTAPRPYCTAFPERARIESKFEIIISWTKLFAKNNTTICTLNSSINKLLTVIPNGVFLLIKTAEIPTMTESSAIPTSRYLAFRVVQTAIKVIIKENNTLIKKKFLVKVFNLFKILSDPFFGKVHDKQFRSYGCFLLTVIGSLSGQKLFATSNPCPPIIKQILHSLFIGNLRLPAGMRLKFSAVGDLKIGVDGT